MSKSFACRCLISGLGGWVSLATVIDLDCTKQNNTKTSSAILSFRSCIYNFAAMLIEYRYGKSRSGPTMGPGEKVMNADQDA